MKKLFCILLAVITLMSMPWKAKADTDLSAYSFELLIQIREIIAQELTRRPEWKEVTVPQGTWKVGQDIPAGHWTITASEGNGPWVIVGSTLEANGLDVDSWKSSMDGSYYKAELQSPTYIFYQKDKSQPFFDIELKEGLFVQIKYASVVFSPFIGKPTLGF